MRTEHVALRQSSPGEVKLLLCVPTGVAALLTEVIELRLLRDDFSIVVVGKAS